MALTDKQIQELNIAQSRVNQGQGTSTDLQNLEYAKGQGFIPSGPTSPTDPKLDPMSVSPPVRSAMKFGTNLPTFYPSITPHFFFLTLLYGCANIAIEKNPSFRGFTLTYIPRV